MKVSVVIPAYNEEPRVGHVIDAAFSSFFVGEVIVVSDGSTDKTSEVANYHGANVVTLCLNKGKSDAIIAGVKLSIYEIVLLIDADLIGLTKEHINEMLYPIINGTADTTLGIFLGGRLNTTLAQWLTPFLSGQRGIRKRIILEYKDKLQHKGYAFETLLYLLVRKLGLKEKVVFLKGSSQVTKEEKIGFKKGFAYRMYMYYQILKEVAKWQMMF